MDPPLDEQLRVVSAGTVGQDVLQRFILTAWNDPTGTLDQASLRARIAEARWDGVASKVGTLAGRVVSHVGLYDLPMRVGRAQLRVAGVNLVCSEPDLRGRGLMRTTLDAALTAARGRGYHLSVLQGGSMYAGFGFAPGWRSTQLDVEAAALPASIGGAELAEFDPGDPENRRRMAALLNRSHAGLTGTVVHPIYARGKHVGGRPARGYAVVTGDGAWSGYALVSRGTTTETLVVLQAAGDVSRLPAALGRLAQLEGRARVALMDEPRSSPLARALGGRPRSVPGTDPWWVLLIDLTATIDAILPELIRRLAGGPQTAPRGTLCIASGAESVALRVDDSDIVVAGQDAADMSVTGAGVVKLVLGCASAADLIGSGEIVVRGEAAALLDVLFPAQSPVMAYDSL